MSTAAHIIQVAVEPKSKADGSRLEAALNSLAKFDPGLHISVDSESSQSIIAGQSERHLDQAIDILVNSFRADVNVSAPQVAYRETLNKAATVRYTHKRASGGAGQFAQVTIVFEPLPPDSGVVFGDEISGGAIPHEFVPAVEKGLRAQASSGLLAGFPVIDFKARLIDGQYHEVDSSPLVFEIAARAAFRELAGRKIAILLEPVMRVMVLTPDEYLGGVVGDLNVRRGQILGIDDVEQYQIIEALVPLASMFGYSTTLNAVTQERAHFNMMFEKYERVPTHIVGGDDDTFPPAMAMRA